MLSQLIVGLDIDKCFQITIYNPDLFSTRGSFFTIKN